MKKINLLTLFLLLVLSGAGQAASAQFNIKIPKIGKPKTEQPKPDDAKPADNMPPANEQKSTGTRPAQVSNQGDYLDDPVLTAAPQFLLETLEIKAQNENHYWKVPTQNDYSCWFPQVDFDVLYATGTPVLRYTAEWTNPDGTAWFTEPLEMNRSSGDYPHIRSPYEDKELDPKAVVTTGTYGLKITDSKSGKTVFQGKFKVAKMLPDPQLKNKNLFYVDNDWNMSLGYVGFERSFTDYSVHTRPIAFFWFKGAPDAGQFEGELYLNGQRVATTDKGGNVRKDAERGEKCFEARDTCAFNLLAFEWENFVLDNAPGARQNNPNGYFTNDHPGEYTIKIFYKGDQVREAKFTVDAKGRIARNEFSDQIFLNDYRVVVPVKVLGTAEKWNRMSWKTDAFYGNPLKGFVAP